MVDLVETETVDLDQVEKTVFKQMNELRLENLFCDVRFNVNGTIMPCHKLVLSALSPYFKTMFNGNFKESNSDAVTINDIETETFEEILSAMYTASIRFHPGNAYFLLRASHLFQLEMIENACWSYIMKNPEIFFLVETCVFAQKNIEDIRYSSLHSKCCLIISHHIIEYGKTNSFGKIPISVFEKILHSRKRVFTEGEEELVILLIKKWSKQNNASCKDIEILLKAAGLKTTKLISSSVMSQLLASSDDKFMMNDENNEATQELFFTDSDLPLNLYVNVIDIETGQRGWGAVKLNVGMDNYDISSFHPTMARSKKVCRVGTKLYCFEIFKRGNDKESNFFSFDEKDDIRTTLTIPSDLVIDQFEITAVGTSIYLMVIKPYFLIWLYDCETSTWNNILRESDHLKIYRHVYACTFSGGCFYIIAQKVKSVMFESTNRYIFSITRTETSLIVKELVELTSYSPYENVYLCAFDGRIAVSLVYGTRHLGNKNAFKIFDIAKGQWLKRFEIMESRNVNFHIFHYDGSVYFVENDRAMIPNQKCDLSSGEWINLPYLPKQIAIPNSNQVLATGQVFGFDVIHI